MLANQGFVGVVVLPNLLVTSSMMTQFALFLGGAFLTSVAFGSSVEISKVSLEETTNAAVVAVIAEGPRSLSPNNEVTSVDAAAASASSSSDK